MTKKLTSMQIDALKEATNIGAGHAAIALSQMVNQKIMIAVTSADIIPSDVFLEKMFGDRETIVTAVYLKTLGDVQGAIIFMFEKESALKLCDLLQFKDGAETTFIDEKCQSVLKELGNILTGSFFSVLADMLGLKVFNLAPCYAYDSAETIMFGVCEQAFGNRDKRLCLATEFIESRNKITGTFAFVPTDEAMEKILSTLGEK